VGPDQAILDAVELEPLGQAQEQLPVLEARQERVEGAELLERARAHEHRGQRDEVSQEQLREQVAARRQFALVHERIADVPTLAFQSRDGWASQLLLLPDELCRVLGDRNGLVLAPMRDLIVSLPLGVEREFADWLLEEFAAVDMNALAVPPLALVDGHLTQAVGVPRSLRRSRRAH